MQPGSPADRSAEAPALLYLATVPQPIRNFYLPYAAHFRARGWRVAAAAHGAIHEPALAAAFDDVRDVPLFRSVLDWRNYVQGPPAIRRLLDRGYDVVHVHTPIAAFMTRLAARSLPRARRPGVVYTAHGFHFHRGGSPIANLLFRTAERFAGRWTDRLVVINEEDELAARTARLVPGQRLVRMPGVGIDPLHYDRAALPPGTTEAARDALGAGPGVPLFVMVGELHPNKRHRDVIDALPRMRNGDAMLAIIGEGRARASIEALVKRRGLSGRVRLLGFVDDPRPHIAAATALVLASRREGLPRAVMEAMALEVPVIVSRSRGSIELVQGGYGQVVPVGSVAGLAAAMDATVGNPEGARDVARRARQHVVECYSLTGIIARHEAMYAEVLREVREARAGRRT